MPPFGFGFSLPALRKTGAAPFVPVTLVTESWAGSGLVNGKVPTTGGGTWVAANTMTYGGGVADPNGQSAPTAYHSATYTNARFIGTVYSGLTGVINQPLYIYARGDINTSSPPTCYYVACNASPEELVLVKRISGAETTLGTVSVGTSGVGVGLQVSGSAIKVYYNGAVVISVTDASITAAGYWGFGLTYGESGEDIGNSTIGPITIQTA